MPYFQKEALSKYIGTGCTRQLRLYLTPDNAAYRAERQAEGMPPPQQPRPGLEYIAQAGEEWGAEKVGDLAQTFGAGMVVGTPVVHSSGQTRYGAIDLGAALAQAVVGQFLAEAEYRVGPGFETALGIGGYRARFHLDYARMRPDLIELLPPGQSLQLVLPDGDIQFLLAGDQRIQLRIIDVKLTAEPSPPYFAEVTLYAMTLAGWLHDAGLDQQYVVVPECAIWPGSHEASRLVTVHQEIVQQGGTPTSQQLRDALAEDLELVPFEAFSFRLQRFFQEELPDVLAKPWQSLPFHVDNRCRRCEYLGYPWKNAQGQLTNHADHCMPTAIRQDHLSRVAFVTRGASSALQDQGITSVAALSGRPSSDPAFNAHHQLRATRTVVAGRAASLVSQQPAIPPAAGTSAVMPRWADLHVYLSADFDIGSAITLAFGLEAFWMQPVPFGQPRPAALQSNAWRPPAFVVDQKSLVAERRELLALLNAINDILTWARTADPSTTVQFYLWDTLHYDHLTRVIGRHLQAILADRGIQRLAWLFPPEQLLPNPTLATRQSPVTIVRDVARAVLAAPIPHYYSLLQTARVYHHAGLAQQMANLQVHPLFEDELSDQIPSERAHEIWSRATRPRHWTQQLQILQETVRKRLLALSAVTRRLEEDLRQTLGQTAAGINIQSPAAQPRMSEDSQLWYAFAKLDNALTELEVYQKRAMPPHEREARFDSARLPRRLGGGAAAAVLARLGLAVLPGRMVYELRAESLEVKRRERDFTVALSPEQPDGFLGQSFRTVTAGTWLEPISGYEMRWRMEQSLGVTVAALDREHRFIVLDAARWVTDPSGLQCTMFDALEALRRADFSRDVILDPTHQDFFTKKLEATLQAIGNPQVAQTSLLARQALGRTGRRGAHTTPPTPAADLLWDAPAMYATPVPRQLGPVKAVLAPQRSLNLTQWHAWQEALTRRVQLIWGPPGTGKSRTVTSVILGAALEAAQQGRALRILITAFTYTAIDTVLLDVYRELPTLLPAVHANGIYRVRSTFAAPPTPPLQAIDVELSRGTPPVVAALWTRLTAAQETTIVAAPVQQVHNLLTYSGAGAQAEVFDLIVIDEASQMDVANATLALASLATGGSVVLAGDPLQLAPIHQAEAPLGLETRVGSIYTYCQKVHGLPAVMLDENYRSNATLVEFARSAGYLANLSSYSPDLRLDLLSPLPTAQPANWPTELLWTPNWSVLLDPAAPAVCFVYPEGRSSQSNPFEADAVAAILWLLAGRLGNQLQNERDPSKGGAFKIPATRQSYTVDRFWQRGVGVVTPHRAQEGLIISRLCQVFPQVSATLIRDAVDTVERFQGQERDVIIASFSLGDPDVIFQEDEFLLSLNRFNVLASRARAKLVVFITQDVVDHLSGELEVLRESRLLKTYAQSFCGNPIPLMLGHLVNGAAHPVAGTLRSR